MHGASNSLRGALNYVQHADNASTLSIVPYRTGKLHLNEIDQRHPEQRQYLYPDATLLSSGAGSRA
jgi:hypothetical protein